MENQSKQHIQEINKIHEHYQYYVMKSQEYEEKCISLQKDAENAIQSERAIRREFKRLQMQNDSLLKRLSANATSNTRVNHRVAQLQDFTSDSHNGKDFIVGSSSVIINESVQELNFMRNLSNPMSSTQNREELQPPIVAGPGEAAHRQEAPFSKKQQHQNERVGSKTHKNSVLKCDFLEERTSAEAEPLKSNQEHQQMKRKKRQLFSNMESIQVIYDQEFRDKLCSDNYSKQSEDDLPNRNNLSDLGLKSLKENGNGGSSNETRVLS